MKVKLLLISSIILLLISCKKSNSSNGSTQPDAYMNTTAASSWNYQRTNSGVVTNYTVTSTNRDSTINGRSYHVYTNSIGGNQYYSISGNDYYQFDSLPAPLSAGVIERLYLKDNAAAASTWTQNVNVTVSVSGIPITIPLTLTNTIAQKGIARTVNGVAYSDVIDVSTSLSSTSIPSGLSSTIHSYYTRKYGLIENTTVVNLNYLGIVQNVNLQIILMSATLH